MTALPFILAQASESSIEGSIATVNERLRVQLDILNHPDSLAEVLTQINLVWAVIFIIVGAMCILNGYRWHKGIIILLAGLAGIWAGITLGAHVGSVHIAAACFSILFAIVAWPLLRYAVSLFGGLAGAFAGANIWTAAGMDPQFHYMGAIIGLIIVGMLAFMAFRAVVVVLTSVGGASMLTLGLLAAMLYIQGWHEGIISGLQSRPLIVPVIVASAAIIGAVVQYAGGVKGLNELADKADPVKAKQRKTA